MRHRIKLAIIFMTLSIGSATAAGPITPFHMDNWNGGSYTDDKTGQFSHCVAGSQYVSGIFFNVSVNRMFNWALGFGHQDWKLTLGQTIPIDLTFDGRGNYHVYAVASMPSFVIVNMPDNSKLVEAFRKAKTMTAYANGQLYQFNLTSTSRLIPALVSCVRENLGMTAPKPITSTPPVINVPSTLPTPPQTANSGSEEDLHTEAMELATNFILNSRMDGAKLKAKTETPKEFVSFGATWTAIQASGAVKIISAGTDTKGIDVAASVSGADAKECQGKFLSARMSELLDSDVVFRGMSSCEDSNGFRSSEYFVIPRKKGGFVLFSVSANGTAEKPPVTQDKEQLVKFEKAALMATQ